MAHALSIGMLSPKTMTLGSASERYIYSSTKGDIPSTANSLDDNFSGKDCMIHDGVGPGPRCPFLLSQSTKTKRSNAKNLFCISNDKTLQENFECKFNQIYTTTMLSIVSKNISISN